MGKSVLALMLLTGLRFFRTSNSCVSDWLTPYRRILSKHIGTLLMTGAARADCGLDVDPVALDADRNGDLSREETGGTALGPVFDRVDRNGDSVISQYEFAGRCVSMKETADESDGEPSAVERKAAEKVERQRNRTESRVDQKTDSVMDKAVDKALDGLFD